jgi:hypothetical protein
MGELVMTFLIFMVVIAISAILFGGWVFITIVRMVLRLLFPARTGPREVSVEPSSTVTCSRERCRASNPPGARFCRRCGRVLPAVEHVPVRRVAMW